DVPPFYAITDPEMLRRRAKRCGAEVPIVETTPGEAVGHFPHDLPVVPLENGLEDNPGRAAGESAAGVIEAIERGVGNTMEGWAAALVTGPIAKKPLYDAGFNFPGHTEFLGHLAEQATGRPVTPVMMLAAPELRTAPVTVHVPLRDVPDLLTSERIVETGRIVARELADR